MNIKKINGCSNPLMGSLVAVPACQQRDGDADWFPAVDVTEAEDEYVVEVDLPGLRPEEVHLSVDRNGVFISGERFSRLRGGERLRVERPSGAFLRRFALPQDARTGEIHANFRDGMLELRLSKNRPEIQAGQAQALAPEPQEAAP